MESKEKILQAAIEIFSEKGKYGARMEEIASRADINKAMLYYFYASRENLFRAALLHIFEKIFSAMELEIAALKKNTDDPVEFLKSIVRIHFQVFSRNVHYTRMLIQALVNEPQEVKTTIEEIHAQRQKNGRRRKGPLGLIKFIEDNTAKGVFRHVDAKQIMASITGLNMTYYAMKPIAETLMGFRIDDEKKFLKERQESNIDLLLNGILKKRSIA